MSTKQLALLYWFFSSVIRNAVIAELGPRITPPPVLQARDASQLAGFIGGDPGLPLTCRGTSTISMGPDNVFGFCDDGYCWLPAICVTSDSPICTSASDCPYSQITRCTDPALPSCAEYILRTNVDDKSPYTNFLCSPQASTILVFAASNSDSNSVESSGVPLETSSPVPLGSSSPSDGSSNGGDGGSNIGDASDKAVDRLTKDQRISLGVGIGVGIGVGLPSLIIGILAWRRPRRPRQ
ncbi:hypothetical protein GGR58DRAFT_525547 [Xylaria digitata]|nr:hypothetical protein GGR58DRAFT_525547 [Xylaria digitata]